MIYKSLIGQGWHKTDKNTLKRVMKYILAAIQNGQENAILNPLATNAAIYVQHNVRIDGCKQECV